METNTKVGIKKKKMNPFVKLMIQQFNMNEEEAIKFMKWLQK